MTVCVGFACGLSSNGSVGSVRLPRVCVWSWKDSAVYQYQTVCIIQAHTARMKHMIKSGLHVCMRVREDHKLRKRDRWTVSQSTSSQFIVLSKSAWLAWLPGLTEGRTLSQTHTMQFNALSAVSIKYYIVKNHLDLQMPVKSTQESCLMWNMPSFI